MDSAKLCLGILAFISISAWAQVPNCLSSNGVLPINNSQVLNWKLTTPNQYHARAHIKGTMVQVYSTSNRKHEHFEVQIGQRPTDTIEIVYNERFGALPRLAQGDAVEVCGDYITATRQAGYYPPSPDGALLHWVHTATSGSHPSGFVAINGVTYGNR